MKRFFLIGAGRCGTTSVCDWLSQIPGIAVSSPKETNFFCEDSIYSKGLDWYEQLFSIGAETTICGEGSVHYSHRSYCPQAAVRIHRAFPQAKILMAVRHPFVQILSNWRYAWVNGYEKRPFSLAICENPSYLERCDYDWQLEPYMKVFPIEQVHVFFYREMLDCPEAYMTRLLSILGVALPSSLPTLQRLNAGAQTMRSNVLIRKLRRSTTFINVRRLVPERLRILVDEAFKSNAKLPVDSCWTRALYEWAAPLIVDRSVSFLASVGKPADFWDFSREAVVGD